MGSLRDIARLAGRQHNVVTLDQLLAAGLSKRQVHIRVLQGVLVPRHRTVYMVGTDRLTPEGEWMAAVLTCGPGALLSHESAASLWRIIRTLILPVHVTAPTRRRRRPGLITHCASVADSRVQHGIPVTTPARTIADLPRELRDEARVKARVNRLLTPDEIRALTPVQRTRSALERRFLRLVADLHPEVNQTFAGYERDFAWPELRLCVEVDGPHHLDPAQAALDRARDRTLIAEGWRVLRAGADDQAEVAAVVRTIAR